ncbi:MAG: helix-turn-helix transcriptional regulator [Cytophagales bacterium]|jgi:AraC-like DNA-binding protein|nr:helix-turn-helix transcriptional regulator [Cytophagales bacterium]
MKIDFNLLVIFHLLVMMQGFSAGILLLFSHSQPKQNRWLGWLIVGMTLQAVNSFLSSAGIYRDYNGLYFMPLFYTWSYGALVYFYLRSVSEPTLAFKPKDRLHFIPVAVQALFYLFVFVHDLEFKTWFWIHVHKPVTRFVDYYGGILLVFFYLSRSYQILQKTEARLRWFVWALVVFYVVAAIDPLFNQWYLPPDAPKFYLIEYVLPIFTYWLGLTVYWREKTQQRKRQENKTPRADINAEHLQKIVAAMQLQQLYLDPELTLTDLARMVELTPNTVSQCLNVVIGKSFNDFVNGYRIEEVKRRLQTPDAERLTILGIAYESGFNSKTTFNRVFKETTGFSPKDYKNKSQTTLRDDGTGN